MRPWDLSVVLTALRTAPFEPVATCSMKFLTMKLTFLLALATGRRRSELHAIGFKSLSWNREKQVFFLHVLPNFVSKTRISRGKRLEPVELASLRKFVDNDPAEMSLCPGRCLKAILTRTAARRRLGTTQLLLIAHDPNVTKDVGPHTISRWIKDTIVAGHNTVPNEQVPSQNIQARQVRVFAATQLFFRAPLSLVLKMGGWMSHNTFTSFYLKESTVESDNGLALAPCLVRGTQMDV